jgi:photosystem II stability/assembly factor-like uncharacterized protein
VLAGLLLAPPAGAAGDRWIPLGPEGGEVLSLLPDPLQSGVVYAGTLGGGVFVSRDGGSRWQPAAAGLAAGRVDALAKGSAADAFLYAGTDRGVYRLAAGGERWQWASAGLPAEPRVGRLAVDPGRPGTVFATVQRADFSGWSVYKSTDGGEGWANATGGISAGPALAISPADPPTLYTASSYGVHRSTDRGATWEISDTGLPRFPNVTDLAIEPGSPSALYAVAYSRSTPQPVAYKSLDGGISWSAAGAGLDDQYDGVGRLAADPRRPGVLYFGDGRGPFRSTDGGGSWAPAHAAPADRGIDALAVDPFAGTVLAGVSRFGPGGDLGVLRSADSGQSWQAGAAGLLGSFAAGLSPDPQQPGRLLLATDHRGILQTYDGGLHWAPAGTGIAEPAVRSLLRDPFSPSTLYALAGESSFSLSRLYRSTDSGAHWTVLTPERSCCLGGLAVDPHRPGTLYLMLREQLLRSTDAGTTWSVVSAEAPSCLTTLAVHPAIPDLLLGACTRDSGLPVSPPLLVSEILRSTDGGAHWTQTFEERGQPTFPTWTLAFDALHPLRVFGGFARGLVRSEDAGVTWTKVESLGSQEVQSVLANPARPGELLAGTGRQGVLRSIDDGASWQPYDEGLLGGDVEALALDPRVRGKVWAATAGAGVYALERAALPSCTDAAALCLDGRFRVTVDWEDFQGGRGAGHPVPLTATTGAFWFFGASNLEMAVKILDGRPVNGHHWVFYGGLSTVRYTLTVLDTLTGIERRYENPSGHLASAGDTEAFPAPLPGPDSFAGTPAAAPLTLAAPAVVATAAVGNAAAPFLLGDGRFRLELRWRTSIDATGEGTGVPLTGDTGTFWYFAPSNLELFVKILDGRALNGHFWIFFGALSDVGFELTVTDTQTGAQRTYSNPPGSFGSRVDVQLF